MHHLQQVPILHFSLTHLQGHDLIQNTFVIFRVAYNEAWLPYLVLRAYHRVISSAEQLVKEDFLSLCEIGALLHQDHLLDPVDHLSQILKLLISSQSVFQSILFIVCPLQVSLQLLHLSSKF